MFIEALEFRIAPASIFFPNDRTATWTDSDGDSVTLTITIGTLEEGNFTHQDSGDGLVVNKLDLTNAEFAGTSLTLAAARTPTAGSFVGNSLVDIGYINAAGNALGAVSINGDLGRIDAGLANLTATDFTAIKTFKASSVGARLDLLAGVPAESEINGKVGSLTVTGEVRGAFHVSGGALGSIDSLNVGALVGGDLAGSGRVDVTGNIKTVTVAGSVQGGKGQQSGAIEAGIAIGKVTLGGSLGGGQSEEPTNDGTGIIRAGSTIGSMTIKGSIFGGTQQESGLIDAGGTIGKLTILGSILGGSAGQDNGGIRAGALGSLFVKGDLHGGMAEHSGFIETDEAKSITLGNLLGGDRSNSGVLDLGAASAVTILGDIVGGDLGSAATADIEKSGAIFATGLSKLIVNGSIRAGVDSNATFDLIDTAAIRVSNALGSLTVKGALLGNEQTRVLITARGDAVLQSGSDIAIGKASFGGVSYADILAGYNTASDLSLAAVNPNAQIGMVSVTGSWIASNLVAGAAYQAKFGDGSDVKSAGADNAGVDSRIASIVIKGAIQGTSASGDHFGFVAQLIGAFNVGIGKNKSVLNDGAFNDNDATSLRYNLANTRDVRLFELAK